MFKRNEKLNSSSYRSSHLRCSIAKGVLKNFTKFTGNACFGVSLLIKLQAQACNFIKKETPTQVFSCEICGIFENTFFYRTPSVAVSQAKKFA